ncbi:FAD-dependent monooxygenase [Pseudoroseicyclus tamaricis]|uniref:FAD-dependent monooxygenase n=1 Tax=Pseudoroseicyclus tamaricis TaxID=2705421 RepID=UPI001F39C9E4|nr:FAD-dependent monooxygenase [Pseudoroseicyclus tamaricis]
MKVIIAGAGVGGLTAALALARAGAEVEVCEQSPALRDAGGGLQITPNGARVLHALGLEEMLDEIGIRSEGVLARDGLRGRTLFHMPIGGDIPYRFVHRSRLTQGLAEAAEAAGAEIRFDRGVRHLLPDGGVELQSGATVAADLAVGAQGIHSLARMELNGETAPVFTRNVAWRAVLPGPSVPRSQIWLLPGRHVVSYPLGPELTNLVAVREQAAWVGEGWHHRDAPGALQGAFADASDDLQRIFARVEEVHLWGLFRHDVAQVWRRGRSVILGDAAHPMLPFLSQGANMAIEDGWALADEVGRGEDIEAALVRFQARRQPRAAAVVAASRGQAGLYHLRGLPRAGAHIALRASGSLTPRLMRRRVSWIYDHDETAARG